MYTLTKQPLGQFYQSDFNASLSIHIQELSHSNLSCFLSVVHILCVSLNKTNLTFFYFIFKTSVLRKKRIFAVLQQLLVRKCNEFYEKKMMQIFLKLQNRNLKMCCLQLCGQDWNSLTEIKIEGFISTFTDCTTHSYLVFTNSLKCHIQSRGLFLIS